MKRSSLAEPRQAGNRDDDPKTVSEAIYRRLRSDIVWGVLAPGAPLRSDELRARYEVGVSPLREALFRLASERFVTSVGQRGFRVATINASDIIDITETRLVIECAALTRSIERGDIAWETRIVATHHALSRASIPVHQGAQAETWAAHHRAFHMALISACGSGWQLYLAALLFDQAERFRMLRAMKVPIERLGRDAAREHQQIVDAVMARDSNAAVAALEEHYRATMRLALLSIDNGGDGSDG